MSNARLSSKDVRSLKGIVRKSGSAVPIDEMNRAVRRSGRR